MTVHASTVRDLPDALHDEGLFFERLAGRRPAVFLDYGGVLTPIVDRPEDAVISEGMRTTVRALAGRCPVCVVSGRDRQVVQELMGVDAADPEVADRATAADFVLASTVEVEQFLSTLAR